MAFKDDNLPMQVLAREHAVLRSHNLNFKDGDPQDTLLMFAEAAIVCMALEHFVRIVLSNDGVTAEELEKMTLHPLLTEAIKRKLVTVPFSDQGDGVLKISRVRNTLLHGNFSQAAARSNCASVAEYFKTQYAGELEAMTKIVDFVMQQIDPATGKRYAPIP